MSADLLEVERLVIEARRELWWFIEGEEDIDRDDAATVAIRIQDELLAKALEALRV